MEEDDDERLEAEAAAAAAEYSALLASAAAGGDGLAERNAPIQYCCDVCGVCPIVGARWHCALCRDFDVCEQCHDGNEEEIGEIHDASHPLERREIRRRRPPTTRRRRRWRGPAAPAAAGRATRRRRRIRRTRMRCWRWLSR